MATFLNGTTIGYWYSSTNYMYGTLTGNVSRSGNWVTLSNMVLKITSRYGNSSGTDSNWYFYVNGVSTHLIITASGYNLGSHNLSQTSFTVSNTQTSASIGWSSSDNYSGSFTVTFPSGETKPSGQYIDGLATSWNTSYNEAQVTWTKAGVTSTGGSLSELYVVAGDESYKSGIARLTKNFTNGSAGAISNNQNDWTSAKIDMAPNKQIYIGMRASNTAGADYWNYGSIVTVPGPITNVSCTTTIDGLAISATTTADAGYYTKTIQYSLDGGDTWQDGTTVSSGAATNVGFSITGLAPDTEYTVMTRVTTDAGSTGSPTVTGSTWPALYGGDANGTARRTIKFYGSKIDYVVTGGTIVNDNDYAKNTIVSFDPDAFMTQYAANFGGFTTEPMYAYVVRSGNLIRISSTRKSPSGGYLINTLAEVAVPTGAYITRYGITVRDPSDTTTSGVGNRIDYSFEQSGTSTKITKLYGSVDGKAKLIAQWGA